MPGGLQHRVDGLGIQPRLPRLATQPRYAVCARERVDNADGLMTVTADEIFS